MDDDDARCLRERRLRFAIRHNEERSKRRTVNWLILNVFVWVSLIIAPSIWLVILGAASLSRLCFVATQLVLSIRARKRYGFPRLHSRAQSC